MPRHQRSKAKISRRTFRPPKKRMAFLIGVILAGFVIIMIRLFYLQVIDRPDQLARQVDQSVDQIAVKASRGNIYDRNNNILVQNASAKAIHIIPASITNEDKLVSELKKELDLNDEEVRSLRKKAGQLENDAVIVKNGLDDKAGKRAARTDKGLSYQNSTLYAYPSKIKNAKRTARTLSATLDNLTYKTAYRLLTQKENSALLVQSKVDNAVANKILKDMTVKSENGTVTSTNGIELIDDSRRYYTNGNFASYVLGFTDQSHRGVSGVESTYNSWLSGEDGLAYLQKDASGNALPSETRVVKEPQKGKDLTLTIDSNIQMLTEKALNQAIDKWKAKRGTAIVLDVKTGEVLAMASKPDYNLNNPNELNQAYAKNYASQLKGKSKTDKLNSMWNNPAVNFTYEPGSTFKPITASSAFEEGAISPKDKVMCNGSIKVNGVTIRCTEVHGLQTAADAVSHSCNPGLVQIIQKLDPTLFYRYAYDFGFGKTTGIELTGEESGIMTRVFDQNNQINLLDYSNLSFGQGLMTTPIQLISALNCVINNGYYMRPTVVLSSKNQGITSNGSKGSAKQIISSATSKQMRKIMEKVVTGNPELAPLAKGYSIGGKTGTAQKVENGTYSHTKYVTSFFGFTPVNNPRYATVVVIDEATSGAYGTQAAAPYGIQILKQISDYKGKGKRGSAMSSSKITVPDLVGQDVSFAKQILDEKGIRYRVDKKTNGSVVTAQSLAAKSKYDGKTVLVLETGKPAQKNASSITVPDVSGMNIQEVNETLTGLGLKLIVKGSGFASSQSVKAGDKVNFGSKITVTFKP